MRRFHPATSPGSAVLLALALLALAGIRTPTAGQVREVPMDPVENAAKLSGSLGLGVGSLGVGGLLALSLRGSSGTLTLRTSQTFAFDIFGPEESATDYALLYGRSSRRSKGWLTIAAGPAVVRTVRPGEVKSCDWFICDFEEERKSTVGLAVQGESIWAPFAFLGLGLTAFGNLNSQSSFAGAVVGIHLGGVR
jgi:hypothetical protein